MRPLTKDDFKKILIEPENSLIKQYIALLKTEEVKLEFADSGVNAIADLAVQINTNVENIGARRLHTILEKVLDEVSYSATDRAGEKINIDNTYVEKHIGDLTKDGDLSKFIL